MIWQQLLHKIDLVQGSSLKNPEAKKAFTENSHALTRPKRHIPRRYHEKIIKVVKIPNRLCMAAKMAHYTAIVYSDINPRLERVIGWRFYTDPKNGTCVESHSVLRDTVDDCHYCITFEYPDTNFWFIRDASAEGQTDRWVSGRPHPVYRELRLGSTCDGDLESMVRARIRSSVKEFERNDEPEGISTNTDDKTVYNSSNDRIMMLVSLLHNAPVGSSERKEPAESTKHSTGH